MRRRDTERRKITRDKIEKIEVRLKEKQRRSKQTRRRSTRQSPESNTRGCKERGKRASTRKETQLNVLIAASTLLYLSIFHQCKPKGGCETNQRSAFDAARNW
jgi:hypothetical protein